jgi:hypothetical protein
LDFEFDGHRRIKEASAIRRHPEILWADGFSADTVRNTVGR